ncbi:MAG TPA: DMT family transporter [Streptosporangiaceae bacterium]
MSTAALALVLLAAVVHASWNLLSKQAASTGAASFIWLLAAAASCLYAPVVAIVAVISPPHLMAVNWLFLAGTGVLQAGYFLFLQFSYRLGDLSVVYPIGRGTGALLSALAGVLVLGERPGPVAVAGICLIIGGIIAIGLPAGRRHSSELPRPAKAVTFALATGVFIASYTVWDKYAVGPLHTPPMLQGYAAFPVMVVVFAPVALRDRKLAEVWRANRPQILGAAVLAPLAYVLVLVALSFSPVSSVAPTREVSVLFGVLLGRTLLGEAGFLRKVIGAAAIVAGILAVAFG